MINFVLNNVKAFSRGGDRLKDRAIINYIKKCNEKGIEMLIDNYNGLLTSVIRTHLNPILDYEEECLADVLFLIWENIEGFTNSEVADLEQLIKDNAHLIIEFSKEGGFANASSF